MDRKLFIVFSVSFYCIQRSDSQPDFIDCFGSNTVMRIKETVRYNVTELESGGCRFHFWTEDNSSIVSMFEGIENRESRDYNTIRIYNGDSIDKADEIRLDFNSFNDIMYDTAIASRGNEMTVLFQLFFAHVLNLTVEKLESECGRMASSLNGTFEIPTYRLSSRLAYPKTLLCVFTIIPLMESTTKLTFSKIDSIKDGEDRTLYSIPGIKTTDLVYEITSQKIWIILDSRPNNNNVSERGMGFSLNYEVCQTTYTATNNSQTLSLIPVIDLENESRCAYILMAENGTVPILSVYNNSTYKPSQVLEIFESRHPRNLLEKLDNLYQEESETYMSKTQEMVVVFTGNSSNVVGANYSSVEKGCHKYYQGRRGAFSPVTFFGKYANNFDCNYTISTGSIEQVFLFISELHFANENCEDYIEIYDGPTMKLLNCEISYFAYAAHTSKVTLRFKTDNIGSDLGFTANWSVCGGMTHSATGAITSSDIFTNRTLTAMSEDCTFVIEAESTKAMYFLLDKDISEEECSVTIGKTLKSASCMRQLEMVKKGLAILRFNITGTSNFTVKWTETSLKFKSESGVIVSFGYPDSYPVDVEIIYMIDTMNSDDVISITFLDFAVGRNPNECAKEYVHVQSKLVDGKEVNKTFCGGLSSLEKQHFSYGSMIITFHTGSTVYIGFRLRYLVSDADKQAIEGGFWTISATAAITTCAIIAVVIVAVFSSVVVKRHRDRRNLDTRYETVTLPSANAGYEFTTRYENADIAHKNTTQDVKESTRYENANVAYETTQVELNNTRDESVEIPFGNTAYEDVHTFRSPVNVHQERNKPRRKDAQDSKKSR